MEALKLNGLNCPHCATQIEDKLNSLPGMEKISLDFTQQTLRYKVVNGHNSEDVFIDASKHIRLIEPHIIPEKEGTGHAKKSSIMTPFLFRIIVSATLFLSSFFVHSWPWFSKGLALGAFALAGWDILWKAIQGIVRGRFLDENFLMSLASICAAAIGEIPEAAGVMIFYQVGEYFQERAVNQSRKSISALVNLRPDVVRVKRGEKWQETPPESVKPGDIIQLKPGERLAVDSLVLKGRGTVDSSSLTGESIPQAIEPGMEVLSGILSIDTLLELEVLRPYDEGALARILHITQEATRDKAPTERFISRFARVYTPIVVGAALLTAILPPLFIGWESFSTWLYRALIFLVVSCPCALVVSIPLSYSAGIGAAARRGVLIKGSPFIDRLASIKTLVLDKTGTLTTGNFELTQIYDAKKIGEDSLLSLAAAAEQGSNHPLARLILQEANRRKLDIPKGEITEIPGKGVLFRTESQNIIAGRKTFLADNDIATEEALGTSVHIAKDGEYLGYILFEDSLRPDTERALKRLQRKGVQRRIILSGDSNQAVEKCAQKLSIDEYQSELLPEEKLEYVRTIRDNHHEGSVAFVGDGINDAPVLAMADVGISMGLGGSDAAVESSDIVLMGDQLDRLDQAMGIAKKTKSILWQNILFALGTKILFLSTGVLGFVGMWEALFADVGVALIAVLNAMRILRSK